MTPCMERTAPWAGSAYGVDSGGGVTVAVLTRRHRGRLVFEPADAGVAAAGENGAVVACAMPPGQAMAVWLQTPLASRAKTGRVLPTLLDMAMPYPLDECIYAFASPVRLSGDAPAGALPLNAGAGGTAALAVAARSADITQRLAALASQGLSPQVLDHEGLALWTQALREFPTAADGLPRIRLAVHVRGREALLAIGHGSMFWSAHRMADGADGSLERTVRVQLDAAAGGRYAQVPRLWIWSGTPPAGWREKTESALPGESVMPPDPATFLARALATRALTDGPLRFNLRRGPFAHPVAERQNRTALVRRAVALAAMATLLLAINTLCESIRAGKARTAEERFERRVTNVAGWPVAAKGETAILIAGRELEARRSAYRHLERAFQPPLLESLAAVLDAAAREQVTVASLLLQPGRAGLQGDAPSRAAAEALKQRLEALHYTPSLKTAEAADGRHRLSIEDTGTKEQP